MTETDRAIDAYVEAEGRDIGEMMELVHRNGDLLEVPPITSKLRELGFTKLQIVAIGAIVGSALDSRGAS